MSLARRVVPLQLALGAVLAAQSGFYLKDGDTVVFYGDSITDHRLYTAFVEAYVVTRFPQLHMRFINSGWGGDEVTGGPGGPIEVRLRRDVIAYHPTVITIMLGMNDGHYGPFDPEVLRTYSTGYANIVQTLRGALPQARITLIEPSPYDDITRPPRFQGGYNSVLIRYGRFVRELAQRENLCDADLNTSVVAALRKAKAKDPAPAREFIPDRVHPSLSGNTLMAEELLKSWKAPATVTAVEIDASSRMLVSSENTDAAVLETNDGLAWTQLDKALPMPLEWKDPAVALAVHSSDLMEAINNEALKVRNLEPGEYLLRIDDETIGKFTADQLARSINLAGNKTPMSRQASEVLMLTYNHNNMHYTHWRLIQTSLEKYGLESMQAAMDALDKLEDEIIAVERATAQPKQHRYHLTRIATPASPAR